ncbi:hypothetical protein [Trichococcus flocculiformis]|uniref:hypothetical protein n=1 Tax=Trichococcus flocculiformis TaxID=82803 RepID=UPI003DA40E13
MNKSDLIVYLMDEYKEALQAFEAEKAWKDAYYQRAEQLRIEDKKDSGDRLRRYYDYYRGRHVPKAELQRIRLMLHKEMLEVERG